MTIAYDHATLLAAALQPGLLPGEEREIEEAKAQFPRPDAWDTACGEQPPCGGCDSCLWAQITYYVYARAEKRRSMAAAGLLLLPRSLHNDILPTGMGLLGLILADAVTGTGPRACAMWQRPRG